jgi:hypothetical protein
MYWIDAASSERFQRESLKTEKNPLNAFPQYFLDRVGSDWIAWNASLKVLREGI